MNGDWLEVIADYADRVAASDRRSDASFGEFTTLHAVYEAREWVAEWLEQSPEPKRHANNWKPDSKSRFAQYVKWRLEQAGRNGEALGWNYIYRLLQAGEVVAIVPTFANGKSSTLTEGSLRPFNWALKNRYADRLPEIVAAAVETAGSVDALTYRHSRDAVNGWKKQWLSGKRGGRTRGAIDAAAKARRLRLKMLDELADLYKCACLNDRAIPEFEGFLADVEQFVKERSDEEAA